MLSTPIFKLTQYLRLDKIILRSLTILTGCLYRILAETPNKEQSSFDNNSNSAIIFTYSFLANSLFQIAIL